MECARGVVHQLFYVDKADHVITLNTMRHTLICTAALVSGVVAGLTATTLNANGVRYYVPHLEIVRAFISSSSGKI